jgi:hypothetical protein
LAVWVSSTL